MSKNKKLMLIIGAVVLALAVVAGVVLGLLALGGNETNDPQSGDTATYTIEVKSSAGIGLKEVGLYIYEDSSMEELITFIKTDENGTTSFTDTKRETYVAVLDKVPTGYEAEAYYPLTGEYTEIVLATGKMDSADVEELTYKLGDAVMDFTVTATDGKEYALSDLFKGKKAVVLNFFYNACQPCMLEFPFLQEAYAEYSDSIAVLAMNPVDGDNASIAALKEEQGITFLMAKCGPEWEKIMQLTAYPTTVIIDRFGNICLIHKGSVTDAKTFKDAFAYFSAEEYEQKLIEDIKDLEIEEPEGSKENPTEVGGQSSFEVTVEPGQIYYYDLYKVFNKYLQIQSENAYVIYNEQTYYPKNGVISLMVSAPDTFTPATIGIGNSGKEKETFKVYLGSLRGSYDNPYSLTLGELSVSVAAGNEQGVYYTYTPTEDGTLTLECLSATSGVKYSYFLFNTVTSAMRNLEADGTTNENGTVSVSVTAKKGQLIQLCFSTLPDGSNSYPAANFKFNATFTAGEVKDQEVEKKTAYTVTVLDDQDQPVPNVSIMVEVDKEQLGFATNTDGVAHVSLKPGSYTGTVYVPDGYTAENTKVELTEAAPNVTVRLTKIRKADYTVKVIGPQGEAVANVFVKIGDGVWLRTDANGAVTENLDIADYAVTIMMPDGYSGETSYAFSEGAVELVITLGYPVGSEQNPYVVESYPFATEKLSGGQEIYCTFTRLEDMTGISIADADAYIRCNGVTYGADAGGVVNYLFEGQESVTVIVGNGGTDRESYTVEGVYPLGTEKNPEQLTSLGNVTRKLETGDADGYYYTYTTGKTGTLTLRLLQNISVDYDVELDTQNRHSLMSESGTARQVTIDMTAGETVTIHLFVSAEGYPTANFRMRLSFAERVVEEPTEPPETDPTDPSTEPSTDPSTEPSTGPSTEPSTEPTTEPTEPSTEPTTPEEHEYTVTVTDSFGAGVSGVGVMFMKDGMPVDMINTNTSGVAILYAEELADYAVELVFTGKEYYYDKAAAVLTAGNRDLTIKLTANVDTSDFQEIYILNGNPAYTLYTGGTRIQLGTGKPNFSAEYESNCFFVFTPQTVGTYQITVTPNVELSFWSATTYISKNADNVEDNTITVSISGTAVKNTTYVIGVKGDTAVSDAVINVARIGDPEFSIAEQPWNEWTTGLTHTDAWKSEVGLTPVGNPAAYYTLSTTPTYVDIMAADGTYNLWYDETNGYYRLYKDGPIVLVDLNAKNRFVSLYERINGNGQYGGSAVTRYFFNESGGFIRKENYTDYIAQCFDCVALSSISESGYHPLTKDLMYALQNGFVEWWNPDSPNYMEGFATANKEYAWMFACCYVP